MFCQEGTVLHTELREKWKAFTEGNMTYSHLFPNQDPKSIKFVIFQQVVIKRLIPTISKDKLHQVDDFIEKRFNEEIQL